MANIAETLIGSALQSAGETADLAGSLQKGAALGMQIEQTRNQRAELEQKKQNLELQKHQTITDDIAKAKGLSGKALQGYMKFIKSKRDHLGLTEMYDDDTLDFISATPENMGRFLAIKAKVRAGDATLEQGLAQIHDRSQFLDTTPDMMTDLYKAAEEQQGAKEGLQRAQAQAKAQAASREDSQRFAAEKDVKQNAQQYATKLSEYKLPDMKAAIKTVEQIIPGGLEKYDGKTEIKGIGGADAALPITRLSSVGRKNRQAALGFGNRFINFSTGANMGIDETARLLGEAGLNAEVDSAGKLIGVAFKGVSSSSDFVNGVKNINAVMREKENTLKAGAGPDAIAYYDKNKKLFDSQGAAQSVRKSFKQLSPAAQEIVVKARAKKDGISVEEARKKEEAQ